MRSALAAALRWIVLPWGKTTGRRIVIDGVDGSIQVYDQDNDLVGEVFADGRYYGNGGGFASFKNTGPIRYVAALSGGSLIFQAADEIPDEWAEITYDRAGPAGSDTDPARLTFSTGYAGHSSSFGPAILRMVSRQGPSGSPTEPYVEIAQEFGFGSVCDLRVSGRITSGSTRVGRVTISVVTANVPVSATVTYPAMVSTVLEGFAQAGTTNPFAAGASIGTIGTTSATVWLNRTAAGSSAVHWMVKVRT
jgi:hypothetical protein